MQYTEAVNLSVFSLIILLLIYYNVRQPLQRRLPQTHVFILIVSFSALVIFLDILSVLSNGQPGKLSFFMNSGFNLLVFTLDIIPGMLWVIYAHLQINQDMKYIRRLKAPLVAIFTLNAALCIINLFTGWVYYVDAVNVFHRAPFYWAHIGLCYAFLFYGVAVVIINKENMEKKLSRGLIVFVIPVTIGGLFQFVYSGAALTWAGLTLSILTIYFNIQNKNLNTDYLTGLYNRRQLDYHILQKIKNSSESRSFSIILIDLDRFKYINDTFGHSAGDQVLQTMALLIRKSVRKEDFVARFGGDEFCIVLDTDNVTLLEEVEKRIRCNLDKFNQNSKEAYQISLSMGYGIYDYDLEQSHEEFVAHVDNLMYQNKKMTVEPFMSTHTVMSKA